MAQTPERVPPGAALPDSGADNRSSEGLPVVEPQTPDAELPLRGYANRGAAGYAGRDEAVQQAVLEALLEETEIQANDLAVSIESGVVTLQGTVRSTDQRAMAVQRAEKVPGVRGVRDRLRVQSTPTPAT